MGASTTYFALAIRHLERLGVCVNSSQSIETVKDKLPAPNFAGVIYHPNTMLVKFPVNIDLVEKQIGFPVVIKTLSGRRAACFIKIKRRV